MAESDVVDTLLPLTAFTLREKYARGREMIDNNCIVAMATDINPGSSFTSSVPLLFALACIKMRLTPEEAVTVFTINNAATIDRADKIGSIYVGKQGDLVLLQYLSMFMMDIWNPIWLRQLLVKTRCTAMRQVPTI